MHQHSCASQVILGYLPSYTGCLINYTGVSFKMTLGCLPSYSGLPSKLHGGASQVTLTCLPNCTGMPLSYMGVCHKLQYCPLPNSTVLPCSLPSFLGLAWISDWVTTHLSWKYLCVWCEKKIQKYLSEKLALN